MRSPQVASSAMVEPCQEFLVLPLSPRPTAHLWGVEAPRRDWFVLREVLMSGSLTLRTEERVWALSV